MRAPWTWKLRSTLLSLELLKVLSFKPGLGQTIALDASLTARNYAGVIPAFLVHSDSFSLSPLNIKWRIT